MGLLTILFEDHTAENFRPLSWSRPVYEIPCALHTVRERVAALLERARPPAAAAAALGLLCRRHLEALHGLNGPVGGRAIGPAGCAELLAAADRVLWLAARLGPRWDVPEDLLRRARAGDDFTWSDDQGLLACACGAGAAAGLLEGWRRWRRQAEQTGCWRREDLPPPAWQPPEAAALPPLVTPPVAPPSGGGADPLPPAALRFLWDLVPALGAAVAGDLAGIVAAGLAPGREPFAILPDPAAAGGPGAATAPDWLGEPRRLSPAEGATGLHPSAVLLAPGAVWAAGGVEVGPHAVIDARGGPVILDRGARVGPLVQVVGPAYLGPAAQVKAGARLGPEVVVGGACRVAGEIAEALICEFSNKQHDGFLGHAVLGSWVNLGAGTTGSDLKNNYGPVRVDLGHGARDSGLRFLGPLIGDHTKTAIGTLLNTGSVVGFAANVFGSGFPPKRLPNFTWGDDPASRYDSERAIATARLVAGRRGVRFGPEHEALFRFLGGVPG